MIMIDWSEMLLPYENKWVAISEDEKSVLASGDTLEQVSEVIETKHLKARYMYVHSFDGIYALSCQR